MWSVVRVLDMSPTDPPQAVPARTRREATMTSHTMTSALRSVARNLTNYIPARPRDIPRAAEALRAAADRIDELEAVVAARLTVGDRVTQDGGEHVFVIEDMWLMPKCTMASIQSTDEGGPGYSTNIERLTRVTDG